MACSEMDESVNAGTEATELATRLDAAIDKAGFWGVVQVAVGGCVQYERAAGYADRAHRIPNTRDTAFAIASGTKAFTALTVMSLVRDGVVLLDDEIHGSFGSVGALVGPGVTIRHLLAHTSGIGDYLDEDEVGDVDDYVLDIPVHRLTGPAEFLPLLRDRPAKFRPGTQFAYCNSAYVLLALLIEELCDCSYYEAVQRRVFDPAGMERTTFHRLDELPGSAAVGYLPSRGWRANHLHLPVRGSGDGGAYSTLDDIARFWRKLFAGAIVPGPLVAEMTHLQHEQSGESRGYGLGFWLARDGHRIQLEGCDAGISFRSGFSVETGSLYTVISNTTNAAWSVVEEVEATLSSGTTDSEPGTSRNEVV